MKEITFKCDKCGKTTDKPIRIEAWYMDKTGSLSGKAYIFNGEESNELDLCEDCAKALNEFIYPMDPEEEEELEEEEEPFIPKKLTDKLKKDLVKEIAPQKRARPGTKRSLDMGKVKALREAGWSLKQIAEEMGGCSPQTIANRLKEEGL